MAAVVPAEAGVVVNVGPSVSSAKPVALLALLEGWAAEKQPTTKTIASWQRVLEQFGTFVGHADAGRLTPENVLQWKAALIAAGFRTKTIRDSKIAPVRAILQWGVDNRKIPTNPAARVVIDVQAIWRSAFGASPTGKRR